jgi:HEAT repeat protein
MDVPERENDQICAAFLRKLGLTEDRQKRMKVLRAYARMNTPLADRILVGALADPCEEIRGFIIRELGARQDLDISLTFPKLAGPPWYARSAVLKIMGMRKDAAAIPRIEPAVRDPNADVRKCAAEALGEIGGKNAIRLLVSLKKDGNPYVRQAAEEGLRKTSEVRFS